MAKFNKGKIGTHGGKIRIMNYFILLSLLYNIQQMKKLFYILIFSLTYVLSYSQPIDLSQFKNFKPRSIGPAAMSGRINAVVALDSDPDIMYVGAAGGGIWKTTSGGVKWEPVFENENTQAIGAISINQQNPNQIWAGTGEGNPRNSLNTGRGIYKSIDAGKTWKHMGLEATKTIHRIIIHRKNSDVVFVGAMGSPWGTNAERGVFKTIDGGKSWRKVLYINDTTGIADLITDPSNPDKLIAATWQYYRKPWTMNSGGSGSGIHISYDAGETWTKVSDGLPAGDLGRIGLAVAPSKPEIIYALVEAKKNALYKSVDGGHKWAFVSDRNIGDRPFYYAELYVDPKNENRIYNLYSSISKSEDGGRSFTNIGGSGNFGGVHPDHHAFYIHPENTDFLMLGNDGGAYISRDGGSTWQFMSNIPVGQFYHVNIDNEMPYNIYGGLQDNGTWVGPSSVWKASGLRSAEWQEVYFGDGFDCMPRRGNTRYLYAMSQGGNLGYVDRLTGKTQNIKPTNPGTVDLRFNWNAALAQDPFTDCGIYYGSQFVHFSTDCGKTWNIISGDLTTNDPAKQKQNESGGLTIDATGAENHCTILSIAPSAVDKNVIWVGTDDGNIQVTKDGGKTWTNTSSKIPGLPANAWIPQIETSAKNANEAWVVVNNYRQNDWKPYLFYTHDFGATWKNLATDKNITGHVWSFIQDPVVSNLMFLGTEEGLLFSINSGLNWQKWTNGLPSTPIADMKIHPRDHDLVIATFGRSYYVMDDLTPLREIAASNKLVLNNSLKLFPIQDAYQIQTRSVDGERFTGNAIYTGTNKVLGAALNIWIKDTSSAKQNESREITIKIFDEAGKNIRNLSRRVEPGFNKLYWNLDRRGERPASYFEAGQGNRGSGGGGFAQDAGGEPGGVPILPGTYKIIVQYGTSRDSSKVNVKQDPRLEYSLSELQAKQNAYNVYLAKVRSVKSGFDKLKEAKKTISSVNEIISSTQDSSKAKITKMGKELDRKIQDLMDIFLTPEDFKGIDRSDRLVSSLQRTASYINSSDGEPTANGLNAIKQVDQRIKEAKEKLIHFFDTDWKNYQSLVNAGNYSLFQKTDAIKLN